MLPGDELHYSGGRPQRRLHRWIPPRGPRNSVRPRINVCCAGIVVRILGCLSPQNNLWLIAGIAPFAFTFPFLCCKFLPPFLLGPLPPVLPMYDAGFMYFLLERLIYRAHTPSIHTQTANISKLFFVSSAAGTACKKGRSDRFV